MLINEAIKETKIANRYILCEKINEYIMERYDEYNMDYHCKRMGIDTTKKLLDIIDAYFYKYFEKDFPKEELKEAY